MKMYMKVVIITEKKGVRQIDWCSGNKWDHQTVLPCVEKYDPLLKYIHIYIQSKNAIYVSFLDFSIFRGGGLHRVPSPTYHGNVFNVITGLFIFLLVTKKSPFLS